MAALLSAASLSAALLSAALLSAALLSAASLSAALCSIALLAVSCAGPSPGANVAADGSCCESGAELQVELAEVSFSAGSTAPPGDPSLADEGTGSSERKIGQPLEIPDIELVDQTGRRVRFYSDLVRGRIVAMNFIFTRCTTICPPLTANMAHLQRLLIENPDAPDVQLLTISVDPLNDTPERMRAFSERFDARGGWKFLTGTKQDVDRLLKALGVFTPVKEEHAPIALVGNDATSKWTRLSGLAPPATLAEVLHSVALDPVPDPEAASASASYAPESDTDRPVNPGAAEYFSDVVLVNQDGEEMRLYSDVIRGKVVVIQSFFTSCTGVCPVMGQKFLALQAMLGRPTRSGRPPSFSERRSRGGHPRTPSRVRREYRCEERLVLPRRHEEQRRVGAP